MSANAEQLERDVLALPAEERARLADKLWASLEDRTGIHISTEWLDEIDRRCSEIDNGQAQLVSGEEVIREARALLERSRSKP